MPFFRRNKQFTAYRLQQNFDYVDQYELRTKPDLAYSPRQMFEMWKQGIPIQASSADKISYRNETDVPLQDRRGIDPAEIWQEQMSSRKRIENVVNGKRKKS